MKNHIILPNWDFCLSEFIRREDWLTIRWNSSTVSNCPCAIKKTGGNRWFKFNKVARIYHKVKNESLKFQFGFCIRNLNLNFREILIDRIRIMSNKTKWNLLITIKFLYHKISILIDHNFARICPFFWLNICPIYHFPNQEML